jgi:hypothetical protein
MRRTLGNLFSLAGKSKAALFAVLSIVAVLLIAGGIMLFKMTGKSDRAEAPAEELKSSGGDVVAAEKALLAARDAYVHGQYANAIEIAKKAVKAEPNQAWRLIGASSCFLKDRNGAMQAWNNLDTQGRSFLMYVCSRNSINLP